MNFKVNDVVRTRDGREVEILKTNVSFHNPVLGIYVRTAEVGYWPPNGLIYQHKHSPADLLPPKRTREVTVWVNVYPTNPAIIGDVTVHPSERNAQVSALDDALAVAVPHTFKLEW